MEETEETAGSSKDKETVLGELAGIAADNPFDLEDVKKERLAGQ
jgi:hypothetical protein